MCLECLDSTAALLVETETRRRRPRQRHSHHRRGDFSESWSKGESGREESGADLGIRSDTRDRQVARKHLVSLAASTIVSFARNRERSGHRRVGSSRECAAPWGELPRPSVAGAGRAEFFSARRKRTENVGRNLGRADEWSDHVRRGHHGAIPRHHEGQPCHGDVIWLEDLSLCEVKGALKSHLCLGYGNAGAAPSRGRKEHASSLFAAKPPKQRRNYPRPMLAETQTAPS